MYKLFTSSYDPKHEGRRQELKCCHDVNIAVFGGKVYSLQETSHRLKYSDLFNCAMSQSLNDDIVVVANSDIIFTHTALDAIISHIQTGEVYCLSRWDFTLNGVMLFDKAWSQDCWIFRGPPRFEFGGFNIGGSPGSDNRMAHEMREAGYKVLNPTKDIQTYHLHLSQHRPDNKASNRVPLPYLFVAPHHIGDEPIYVVPSQSSKRASSFQR